MTHRRATPSSVRGLAASPGSRWRSTWAGGEGGGGGHSPGHVTVWGKERAASCEHDLPGVLPSDGTGELTLVLQVELSSPCTLGSLLSYNTRLYSTTTVTSYTPHCPTTR